MHVSSFQLEALPPYSFELTVHNPAGWYWYNPLEIFSNRRIWAALRLSSNTVVGLRLESLGSVDRPRVLATVFSRQKLKDSEMVEASELVVKCAGLNEDVTEFYEEVREDPVLRYAIEDLNGMEEGCHTALQCLSLCHTGHNPTERPHQTNRSDAQAHHHQLWTKTALRRHVNLYMACPLLYHEGHHRRAE